MKEKEEYCDFHHDWGAIVPLSVFDYMKRYNTQSIKDTYDSAF